MAKPKHFVKPDEKGSWPEPYTVDGQPVFPGDRVVHPVYSGGAFSHCDWVDLDGKWVDPTLRGVKTRRDTTRGHWEAVVTGDDGGYRCPVSELTRA